MSRIMAIDYGAKRTGIAVTDPLQIIAGGLTTVKSHELMNFLKEYIAKEDVESIVVGMPMTLKGTLSENAGRTSRFIAEFVKAFPEIPVITYDERFTSSLAHRTMIDSGIGRKARQNKSLVDEISATIILQSYMEEKRRETKDKKQKLIY